MVPDRHIEIESLRKELAGMTAAERQARIADLMVELNAKLDSVASSTPSLPPPKPDQPLSAAPVTPGSQRFGPWRTTGIIGYGGMGAVFRAVRDDQAFEKQVAIKALHVGIDSPDQRERFRLERSILARLEHPHIARLLDGGETENGISYIVMEYVEGQSATAWCESAKPSREERLRVFLEICGAVEYAHQNLIVHRDLKPGNILVTPEGTTKLLDFGIAKLIDNDVHRTVTSTLAMTPAYASPEQVRGEPITTASDVYSLGVVLYEMLTGRLPYELANFTLAETYRVICETQPTNPRIFGDLDNILLMALRKEPARRYPSVEQFRQDIERYLKHLPVIARKDSITYRSRKYVRRNWFGLCAGAALLAAITGGVVVSQYQARRAERRFQQVRKLANTFLFDFHDKIAGISGTTEARAMIVQTALQYLDSLSRDAAGDTGLQIEIAEAYERVGDAQGNPLVTNLGHTAEALDSYEKALKIAEPLGAENHADTRILRLLGSVHYKVGGIRHRAGSMKAALESYRRGLSFAQQIGPRRPEFRLAIDGHMFLANVETDVSNLAQAVADGHTGLKMAQAMAAEQSDEQAQAYLAKTQQSFAWVLHHLGDITGCLQSLSQAMTITAALAGRHPQDGNLRRNLVAIKQDMAEITGNPMQMNGGDPDGALRLYRDALATAQALSVADPHDARSLGDVCALLLGIAETLRDTDPVEAAAMHRKSLELVQALERLGVSRPRLIALNEAGLGNALSRTGDHNGALQTLRHALEIEEKLANASPQRVLFQRDLFIIQRYSGDANLRAGNSAAAEAMYQAALTRAHGLAAAHPTDMTLQTELATCHESLGKMHATLASQKPADKDRHIREAQKFYTSSLELWDAWAKRGISGPYDSMRRSNVTRLLTGLR